MPTADDSTANNAFERVYLAHEDEPRSANDEAAARALSRYRESLLAGEPVPVEVLMAEAPQAAAEIRAAVEAYHFIHDAASRPSPPRASTAPEYFPHIPGYQILRVLGEGGMGVVYAALQTSLQRPVAIKLLSPRLEREKDVIARFTREIQLLTRLTHPNIVDIIDAGVADGRHYYVMEYVDGLSLERVLRKHRVRLGTALVILRQIVTGLSAAHKQGIYHRDLKPGNILLDRNAVVRIADFGLAAEVPAHDTPDDANTRTHGRLGTAGYMSPEQIENPSRCDARSDLFAVGVIFYQMLTGRLPHGVYKPVAELVPRTTRAVDRLIARCLQPDPDDRYQTCEALLRSIGRLERRIERTRRRRAQIERARSEGGYTIPDETEDADHDLVEVIRAWPTLPVSLQAAILAIVRSSTHEGSRE